MTAYGGQLDFLDSERSWLVDHEMVPVHEPTWAANYRPSDRWAEPSVDQAADHMRRIFEQFSKARTQAQELADQLHQKFSRQAVVSTLLRALSSEDFS
jgi:hypothetical protein